MSNDEKRQFLIGRACYIFGDEIILKLLFHLEAHGEKNFTQLKTELGMSSATLTKKLLLLQKVGLVLADRTHDGRQVFYSLHKHQRSVSRLLDTLERLAKEL